MNIVDNLKNTMETNHVQKTTYDTECKHVMYSTEFSGWKWKEM